MTYISPIRVCWEAEALISVTWGFVCVLQVEEPSILSDSEDAVDSRQWTQHHLAAADIRMPPSMALTPPQGEFDGDCMDVNVRGPGTVHQQSLQM